MELDGNAVLAIPLELNDAGATTVRAYLVALLSALWDKGEAFSGKRPFGNSGWEHDLYHGLVKARAVKGSFDEDGYLDLVDKEAANELIFSAIEALGVSPA